MRPMRPTGTSPETRRAWEPPAITKLAIGTETKSARENGPNVASEAAGSGPSRFAQPQPPAAPATKFGFSVELAFPLSARVE